MTPESYQKMFELEQKHWWFIGRRQILEFIIKKNFLPEKSPLKILEIGSGTGGNIEMLIRCGSVTAIEPNDLAREKIDKRYGKELNLRKGQLPNNLELEGEKNFNLICLFDVLEHVEEDKASLKEIVKLLGNNGKIFITVPAFQFLWSKHDEKLHHKRRYNKNNLKELLKNSELEIIKLSYFNFFLFPIAVISRLLSKILNLENEEKIPSSWLNKILLKVFSSEKIWLRNHNFPIGLSLMCIAKKRSSQAIKF